MPGGDAEGRKKEEEERRKKEEGLLPLMEGRGGGGGGGGERVPRSYFSAFRRHGPQQSAHLLRERCLQLCQPSDILKLFKGEVTSRNNLGLLTPVRDCYFLQLFM